MADFTPNLYGKYVSASILRIIRLLAYIFASFFSDRFPLIIVPTPKLFSNDKRLKLFLAGTGAVFSNTVRKIIAKYSLRPST